MVRAEFASQSEDKDEQSVIVTSVLRDRRRLRMDGRIASRRALKLRVDCTDGERPDGVRGVRANVGFDARA